MHAASSGAKPDISTNFMESQVITKTVEEVRGYSFEVTPHSWQKEADAPDVDYRILRTGLVEINPRVYFGFHMDGRDHTIPVPMDIAAKLMSADGKFRITVEKI